mgnify:CR=1 FL=1
MQLEETGPEQYYSLIYSALIYSAFISTVHWCFCNEPNTPFIKDDLLTTDIGVDAQLINSKLNETVKKDFITLSNYTHNAQVPTTKLKTETTSEPSKTTQ